jgi:DNA-binding Xre family transcriptional regulator
LSCYRESGILWLFTERRHQTLDKIVTAEGELDESTVARYGDIAPRLNEVLHYANYRWGTNISRQELARAIGCDTRTIELFASGSIKHYNLFTTAKFRWYFDCRVADLLQRIPPSDQRAAGVPEADPNVSRVAPPDEPPPGNLVIATRIPELLANYSEKELAAGIPLHRKAIRTLMTRQTTRIARVTLAALCTFLSAKEKREVGIEDLLIDPTASY